MAAGTVKLSKGVGGQQVSFPDAMSAEDDAARLLFSLQEMQDGETKF